MVQRLASGMAYPSGWAGAAATSAEAHPLTSLPAAGVEAAEPSHRPENDAAGAGPLALRAEAARGAWVAGTRAGRAEGRAPGDPQEPRASLIAGQSVNFITMRSLTGRMAK